jgi:hypothetical protein
MLGVTCKQGESPIYGNGDFLEYGPPRISAQAFGKAKAIIAPDVVLAYPDFTKPFEIYTNASTM